MPRRGKDYEQIIHARPCWTLHSAKPSGHGPMTRSRVKFDGTPGELTAEYYAQRASVGLIVAEGTQHSEDG